MGRMKNYFIKSFWQLSYLFSDKVSKQGFDGLGFRDSIFEEVSMALNLSASDIILDVGCGDGYLVNYLKNKGYQSYGLDYFPKFNNKPENNFLVGDVCHIPFKPLIFDIVISYALFHHIGPISNIKNALKELKSIIKEDGKIMIGMIPRKKGYFNSHIKKLNRPVFFKFILYCYMNFVYPYYVYKISEWKNIFEELDLDYKFINRNLELPYQEYTVNCILTKKN